MACATCSRRRGSRTACRAAADRRRRAEERSRRSVCHDTCMSRYPAGRLFGEAYTVANPAVSLVQTTTRVWDDRVAVPGGIPGDFVPQCDFLNSAPNGECQGWSNLNWGRQGTTTTVNPETQEGWGKRNWDWQFSVGVQQEIAPRFSVDVAYSRRWWGNFFVTHNRALTAADYDEVTLTAPLNDDLPGGGGYPVTFLTRNTNSRCSGRLTPTTPRRRILVTRLGTGTAWTSRSMRGSPHGLVLQGGTSTGRGVQDTCDVLIGRYREANDAEHGADRGPGRHRRAAELRFRGALDNLVPRARDLHGSEDRRAGQRHLPFAAERAARRRRGHQRCVAYRELPDERFAVPGGDREAASRGGVV